MITIMMISLFLAAVTLLWSEPLDQALRDAGPNRSELEQALAQVPADQRSAMEWLIVHMPAEDRSSLTAAFLLENVSLAHEAWTSSPWRDRVPEEIFLDAILPYANVNEARDPWRRDFRDRLSPLVAQATSPSQAAAILNQRLFPMVGVRYSTDRPKADQSPRESMEAGMASCTGLSIMLVDACRSVGVPARFVGTPLWSDGSGNHSWVEIYDDGDWHFTGAAEPTGDDLNKGWFTGRAKSAIEGDSRRAIYAVTWRDVPLRFPLSWNPAYDSVRAVDITRRYVSAGTDLPEGHARLRVRVVDESGRRMLSTVRVLGPQGVVLAEGTSRDERFDGNDHLEFVLPLQTVGTIRTDQDETAFTLSRDEQLETIVAERNLDREAAAAVRTDLLEAWRQRETPTRRAELESGTLSVDEASMPIFYSVHGDAPPGGRSLYISMHGGGGAPAELNDRQWRNQQTLYDIDEGVYVAPRAPSNTWNLWHRAHVDPLFDRLITNLILVEGVDPDRVYLTGYSAGGDGVYQLAPRMADRLAAAAMMAGHPNETAPDGLRNLPFTIHMGENDTPYNRNRVAAEWKERLADLRTEDPDGYPHEVVIHADKGHWMDGADAAGLDWMSNFTRRSRPDRIVWKQDDVTHGRFYWLEVDEPEARDRLVVRRDGQVITVEEPGRPKDLTILLDDSMVDLDQPVVVRTAEGARLFEGKVPRRRSTMERTLRERGDPGGIYSGEVTVTVPPSSPGDGGGSR